MKPVWEVGEFMTGVIAFVFFPLGFNKTTLVTESFPPSQRNLMDGFDGTLHATISLELSDRILEIYIIYSKLN